MAGFECSLNGPWSCFFLGGGGISAVVAVVANFVYSLFFFVVVFLSLSLSLLGDFRSASFFGI